MDCYTNNFPGLPRLKKLAADKHVITELPLVPFVIINLTSLTAWRLHESEIQVQGNQRFFFLAALQLAFAASRLSHAGKIQEKPLGPGYF